MRIPSQNVSQNIKMPSSDKPKGQSISETAFLGKSKKVASMAKKDFDSSIPISKQELMQLAIDFKNGTIDRKEANTRFVSAVINNSIQDKLGERDRQKITDDIERFVSEDQDFLDKLAKNLNDLA